MVLSAYALIPLGFGIFNSGIDVCVIPVAVIVIVRVSGCPIFKSDEANDQLSFNVTSWAGNQSANDIPFGIPLTDACNGLALTMNGRPSLEKEKKLSLSFSTNLPLTFAGGIVKIPGLVGVNWNFCSITW